MLISFQRLLAEASRSINERGLALYEASPEKYAHLAELPFPAYIPDLAAALRTPQYAEALACAKESVGTPAAHLEGEALESLRQTFFHTLWEVIASQTWFPQENGHFQRTARVAAALAGELGLPPSEIHEIHWGGLLHDVGKIFTGELFVALCDQGLPPQITLPFIRTHASLGGEFMASLQPLFPIAAVCAAHHQESVDGSGYPHGLKYEQIPWVGQIANLADGYDAVVTRLGWTKQQVCDDIQQMYARAGHPDALVLHAFLHVIEKHHPEWYS